MVTAEASIAPSAAPARKVRLTRVVADRSRHRWYRRGHGVWAAVVVVGLALAVFANTLVNGFTFDDHWIVEPGQTETGLDGLVSSLVSPYWTDDPEHGLYRPVATVSYQIDRMIWGGRPFGYHLTNLLLHATVSLLVFLLARRLMGSLAALVAGAVFAVLPVHTEAVAGVVGRAELLAALGVGGALVLGGCANRRIVRIAGSGLSFGFALLSKESAVVYPLLLVVLELHRARWRDWRSVWRTTWPLLVTAGGVLVVVAGLRFLVLGSGAIPGGAPAPFLDNPLAAASPVAATATAAWIVLRYVWLMLVPWHLSADYSYPQIVPCSLFSWPALAGTAVLGVGAGLAVWLIRRRSPWVVGPLVFLIALLPTSNLVVRIGTIMAERLLYLPSLGFVLLIGWMGHRVGRTRWGCLALVAMVVAYGARTVARNCDWKDDQALFAAAVRTCPRSARAWLNHGLACWQAGQNEHAETAIREAVRLHPDYVRARAKLAAVLLNQGRLDEAAVAAAAALARDPDSTDALLTAGNTATAQRDLERAESCFRHLLRVCPDSRAGAFNLANTLRMRGQPEQAVAGYRDLLARHPDHAGAWTNLVDTLLGLGRGPEALEVASRGGNALARVLERAAPGTRLDPAWGALATVSGVVHLRHGRREEARALLERAVALRPDLSEAHRWLAASVRDTDPRRARDAYRQALRIRPDDPDLHLDMAWLLVVSLDPAVSDPAAARRHAHAAGTDNGRGALASFIDGLARTLLEDRPADRSTWRRAALSGPLPASLRGTGLLRFGVHEWNHGRHESARQAWERGKGLGGSPALEQSLARLLRAGTGSQAGSPW